MRDLQKLLDSIDSIEPIKEEEPKPDKDINLEAELKKYFGYDEFREGQKEIVKHLVNGRNVLASCPTAFGKSICYQLPALITDGLTIVISPLISLMKDQVDNLIKKGIKSASFINSTLSQEETQREYERLKNKEIKLLYISPEKLSSRRFCGILEEQRIGLLIIDEAHCVSQWGHDFRPDYLKISHVMWDFVPEAVGMFTATATKEVKKDIVKQITPIGKTVNVNHSVERNNLKYSVINVETNNQKYHALAEIIQTIEDKGIVYAGTRKKVEEISKFVETLNIKSDYYHAGRPKEEREFVQNSFFADDGIQIIVATNTFGMGVDKADIRYVVHWDMPGNLENYSQESGRAGRDGQNSICVLLYKPSDEGLQEWFNEQSAPDLDNLVHSYEYIYNKRNIEDYRLFSMTDLADEIDMSEDNVKIMLSKLKQYNIIEWHNNLPTKINIEVKTIETDKDTDKLKHKEEYDYHEVCELLQLNPEETYSKLSSLQREDKIRFWGKEDATTVELIIPIEVEDINLTLKLKIEYENYFERKNQKIEQHLEYVRTKECRQKVIKEYFGETHTKDCGNCDNCNKHLQELDANMLFAHLWLWAVDDETKEKPKPIDLEGTYYEEIEENTYIDEDICPF